MAFFFLVPLPPNTFAIAFKTESYSIIMAEWIELNRWGVMVAGIFFLCWMVQLYYFFAYFLKSSQVPKKQRTGSLPPVSVVICARNEENNLMEHIPYIMEQDYPEFELVVVNDSSWDDTENILKALSLRYPNLRVVNLDEEKQNLHGKKFALTLGIKAAKYDTLLLTDADCLPSSNQWIRLMSGELIDKTQLVLGFSPYKKYDGWLNKIIRFDTLMIGAHYLGFARAGKAYMGVGRNMMYTKELFFSVGGFKSHYSIASGDDDLFVNQVATPRNTTTMIHPDGQTVSEPKKTWNEWFIQKRRHFTTAPYYKPAHRNMLMAWPVTYFLMIASFVSSFFFLQTIALLVSGLLLVRYIVQIAILHRVSKRLKQARDLAWLSPILELHLHVLNLWLYLVNLVRKPQKWN